ncbi:MAG: TRC40/GET3/ArsA family transport-energizing ATPase [Pelolinea sp.]|nr:TRC40/GET3/ArsA family transport-energizing ATPase [Pelolinea sp.]
MGSQYLFYSGKGGVGKTSMACVTAVRLADEGKRTLIVTTDPASNLADVFEQKIGHEITPVSGVKNLWAMEIDPDIATSEYIDKAMAPIRAAFPPQIVQVMEEQMSGPCTAEVAAFDRFTDFLDTEMKDEQEFDTIIFDTAPTGHTIRLLELPSEWSQSIDAASEGSGQTCIGPAAAIQDAKHKYERALGMLRDTGRTVFNFVLQPEAIAIKETKRAIGELEKLDIHSFQLIVNGVIPAEAQSNPLFSARAKMQYGYLDRINREFTFSKKQMRLLSGEINGVERLRDVGRVYFDGEMEKEIKVIEFEENAVQEISKLSLPFIHELSSNGHRHTVFFAGKGGVGKTVASCISAIWLARSGYKTLLVTTDPAAHLGDVLGIAVGDHPAPIPGIENLWAAKIDPKSAAEEYKKRILDDAKKRGRPPEAIKTMEEELDSPCTEEMAAFDQFIDLASQSEWKAVVFDTAPTGHTLRLLELPVDWSKQIDIKAFASIDTEAADDAAKQKFGKVIDMMKDPAQSTFSFVMFPESTPILEAYRASQELATLDIHTGMVVANYIIPQEQTDNAFVHSRRAMQNKYLQEISRKFNVPIVQIPLLPQEIKGLKMLTELGEKIYGKPQQQR